MPDQLQSVEAMLAVVRELPREHVPVVLVALAARLAEPPAAKFDAAPPPPADTASERGQLVTVAEVAERLGVSKRWVYRHAGSWGFTRRLGHRTLRFERRGFEKFLQARSRL